MAERFSTYVQFRGSERPAPADATLLAPVPPDEMIEVSLYLRPRDAAAAPPEAAIDTRAAVRSRCKQMHRDDIRLVADFAAANGLTVVTADAARRLVRLAGPVSRMERAFRTSLRHYRGADDGGAPAPGPNLRPGRRPAAPARRASAASVW